MRFSRSPLWLSTFLLLSGGLAASAQDEGSPPVDAEVGPAPTVPSGVETIEVIGERENAADVQDEAQAITAFDAEDLERANIVNIDSLAFGVPGLHVGQSGQEAIVTLRGIGTENASITGEPGVAFHVDGVNYAQPAAARVAFFDVETLDVKLGPQGLSGGKNSTSGTINLITKKPSDEYQVDGDVIFGNYDRVRAKGALNVPLGELAATRVALFYEDRDGYLDNVRVSDSRDPFDADDFGLRTHLRWNPADSVEVLLSYSYFRQGGNGPQSDLVPIYKEHIPCPPGAANIILRNPFPGDDAGPSVMPVAAVCNRQEVAPATVPDCRFDPVLKKVVCTGQAKPAEFAFIPATEDPNPRDTYANFLSSQSNRFWGWTSHVDWDTPELPGLGETRLALIGGFQRTEQNFDYDADSTDLDFTELYTERGAYQYSGEIQWSGVLGERIEWQAGGLFARERGFRDLHRPKNDPSLAPLIDIEQDTENKSYSTWLNTSYDASDSVRLSLGGRWIKDQKRAYLLRFADTNASSGLERFTGCTGFLDSKTGPPPKSRTIPSRPNPWCTNTYRGTMWGAGIDWRPGASDDHLLFAKIDRGHKSGGFRAGGRGEYKPEKNWAYSLGSKSSFFDGRFQLNLDGFVYQYTDMQLVVLDELVLRTENTDARMYGWDLKAVAAPVDGLRLEALVSNLHTETLDYFSLDPANQVAGANSTSSNPLVSYNSARLFERYLAETYAVDDERGRPYAESRQCISPPPDFDPPPFRCGDTGDRYGLDDFSGNDLSRAPEWKVTLSGEYEIPIGRWGSLTPRVQYSWNDDTYFRAFNQDFDLQEAYHQTDAKLIWTSPEQHWEAEVFVTNIEDEAPIQNLFVGARSNGAPPVVWWGPARFYGFRVGFKY
jgi:iron complex outermembrane receptor protein